MIKRQRLTVEQDTLIKSSYEEGLGCKRIMKKHGLTLGQVNSSLRRQGVEKRKESDPLYRKHQIDDTFFENIDTPEKAYFLGWFYSDGYNQETQGTVSITLNKKDESILKELGRLIFKDEFKLLNRKTGPGLYIHSKKISQDLVAKGCYQNKSLTLEFPTNNQVPESLLADFIRGVFDGDGCFYSAMRNGRARGVFSIVGSENFIISLSKYFSEKSGVGCKPYKCKGCWRFSSESKIFIEFVYKYLYNDSNLFLKRKKQKFKEYFKSKK